MHSIPSLPLSPSLFLSLSLSSPLALASCDQKNFLLLFLFFWRESPGSSVRLSQEKREEEEREKKKKRERRKKKRERRKKKRERESGDGAEVKHTQEVGMPRYYCDYCDAYLTHDSRSVRKQHCSGFKHKVSAVSGGRKKSKKFKKLFSSFFSDSFFLALPRQT